MWHQRMGCKPRPCLASLHARRYTYRPVRRQPHCLSPGKAPHKENAVKFHAFMYVTIGRRQELEQGIAGKNPTQSQPPFGHTAPLGGVVAPFAACVALRSSRIMIGYATAADYTTLARVTA